MPDDELTVNRDAIASRAGEVVALSAKGELDSVSCDDLEQEVAAAVAELLRRSRERSPEAAPPIVVLDLTAVTFCDSRGLGTLIGAVKSARREGASLRLVARSDDPVTRLVRRVALEDSLTLHPSIDAAVAARRGSTLEAEVADRAGPGAARGDPESG